MVGAKIANRLKLSRCSIPRAVWVLSTLPAFVFVASSVVTFAQNTEPAEKAVRKPNPAKNTEAALEKSAGDEAQAKGPNVRGNLKKEADPLVQLIRSMTPEQKNHLIENIKAWEQLTPELKQALRAREKSLRKNISDEVEEALQESNLSPEQKDLFEKRYKEERKKLDLALRMELDARRKESLSEIVTRLKQEVAAPLQ